MVLLFIRLHTNTIIILRPVSYKLVKWAWEVNSFTEDGNRVDYPLPRSAWGEPPRHWSSRPPMNQIEASAFTYNPSVCI